MLERVHSVFVSSTYADLQPERLAITDGLLRSSCLPAGMELFSASGLPPWETITRSLDLADYLILVLAGRYGSLLKGTGKSYTENEYDYAVEHGIPVLVFAHADIRKLPFEKIEEKKQRPLKKFRDRVLDGRHTAVFWTDLEDLRHKVAVAVPQAVRDIPRAGWVRGDRSVLPDANSSPPSLEVSVDVISPAPLCALRNNDEDLAEFVDGQKQALLDTLPTPGPRRSSGAAAILGLGVADYAIRSRSIADSMMAPDGRTRQQFIDEVDQYGLVLGQALQEARNQLAAQRLSPFVVGLHNRRQANLRAVQLRLYIDGDIDVALPLDDDEWSPLGDLPEPPRKYGPQSLVHPLLPSYRPSDLLEPAPEVEVRRRGEETVLTYPSVDLRPDDEWQLAPVVLLVADSAQRARRARWTLTAKNVDAVAQGDLVLDFAGAPRDVWREWAAESSR